jgi:hypothetical protein
VIRGGPVALAAGGAVILLVGRGLTFVSDEWSFITGRLDWDVDAFLRPHNEHLHAVPVLLFKTLFSTIGIAHYLPYRAMVLIAHLLCVVLLFALVRKSRGALVAVCATLPLILFGPAWEVILWPFMIAFVASVACGLGVLLLLPRATRVSDAGASALLAAGVASSSFGVSVALGVLVELLLRPAQRRRWWVAAAPLALYGLWYAAYDSEIQRQGPLEWTAAPAFLLRVVATAVAGTVGAPLGVETLHRPYRSALIAVACAVTVALVLLAAWRVARHRAGSPRLAMIVVTLGTYWAALSVTRAYTDWPYASKYLYPAAFFLVLLLLELAPRRAPPAAGLAVLASLSLGVAAVNAAWLRWDAARMRVDAGIVGSELGALTIARERVAPGFEIDPKLLGGLTARGFFEATDRLNSSPAYKPAAITATYEKARRAADDALLRAYRVRPVAYAGLAGVFIERVRPAGPPPRLDAIPGTSVRPEGRCSHVRGGRGPGVVQAVLPAKGLVVEGAGVSMQLRRFSTVGATRGRWRPTGPVFLRTPPDPARRAWRIALAGARPFSVC